MKELSDEVKNRLNDLTREDLLDNYALGKSVLIYGVDAIAQIYVMNKAKENLIKKGPLNEFMEENFLEHHIQHRNFKNKPVYIVQEKYKFPLEKINGIFIPKIRRDRKIVLFDRDYLNMIDNPNGIELANKKWQKEDFVDKKIIERGIKFGEEMWKNCVEEFYKTKDGVLNSDGKTFPKAQSEEINYLGEELINYYSSFINE